MTDERKKDSRHTNQLIELPIALQRDSDSLTSMPLTIGGPSVVVDIPLLVRLVLLKQPLSSC